MVEFLLANHFAMQKFLNVRKKKDLHTILGLNNFEQAVNHFNFFVL